MENYAIRIYHRQESELHSLVGVVECIDRGEKHVFRTIDELWDVLNADHLNRREKSLRYANAENCVRMIPKQESKVA